MEIVPVNEFGGVGVVEQVDGDGGSFTQADQGAWNLTVVTDGADGVILRDVDEHGRDAQRDIGGSAVRGRGRRARSIATGEEEAAASGRGKKVAAGRIGSLHSPNSITLRLPLSSDGSIHYNGAFMPLFRIHRMKDTPRQQFRWAPHVSGVANVKPKDYELSGEVEAENEYAAWALLRGSETPLLVGERSGRFRKGSCEDLQVCRLRRGALVCAGGGCYGRGGKTEPVPAQA